MSRASGRHSWPVVLAAGAALLLAALAGAWLVFQPNAATSSGAIRLVSQVLVDQGVSYAQASEVVGFVLNVALFVPGAFAAALLWPRVRWWQWVLVGLAITVSIETVQGVLLPRREAQVHDLVANTLGAALGAGVGMLWHDRSVHGSEGTGPEPRAAVTQWPQHGGTPPRPGRRSE